MTMNNMQMLWVTANRIDIGTYFIGPIEFIRHLNNLGHNTRSVSYWETKKRHFALDGKIMYVPRPSLEMFGNKEKQTFGIPQNYYKSRILQ